MNHSVCDKKIINLETLKTLKILDVARTNENQCVNKSLYDSYINDATKSSQMDKMCSRTVPDNGEFDTYWDQNDRCSSYDVTTNALTSIWAYNTFKKDCNFIKSSNSEALKKVNGYPCKINRKAYKADPKACCWSDSQIIDKKTCDPKYTLLLEDCKNFIYDDCLLGEKFYTDKKCMKWCENYPELCDKGKLKLCNNKKFFDLNKQICMRLCVDNIGKCDEVMEGACTAGNLDNLEEKQCACFNLEKRYDNLSALCSGRCAEVGYKPKTLSNIKAQCNVVNCEISLNGEANFDKLNNNVLYNNCGSKQNTQNTQNTQNKQNDLYYTKINLNKEFFPEDKRLSNLEIMIPSIIFIVISFFVILWLIYIL